jgi:hypothetical protein
MAPFFSHYRRLQSVWSQMVSWLTVSLFYGSPASDSCFSVNIFLRIRCQRWGSGIQASSWWPEQQPSKGWQGRRGEYTLSAEISIKEFSKLIQFITVGLYSWECLLERTWTSCFCLGCIPRAADYKGLLCFIIMITSYICFPSLY